MSDAITKIFGNSPAKQAKAPQAKSKLAKAKTPSKQAKAQFSAALLERKNTLEETGSGWKAFGTPETSAKSDTNSLSTGGPSGWPKGWSHAASKYNPATGKYEGGGPVFIGGDVTQADVDAYNQFWSHRTEGRVPSAVSLEGQQALAVERAEASSSTSSGNAQSLSTGSPSGWPSGWSHAAAEYNPATGKYEGGGPVFIGGDVTQADVDAYNQYWAHRTGGRVTSAVSLEEQQNISFERNQAVSAGGSTQNLSTGGPTGWPKGWSLAAPKYNILTGNYEGGGPIFIGGVATQADVDAFNQYWAHRTGGQVTQAVSLEQQSALPR